VFENPRTCLPHGMDQIVKPECLKNVQNSPLLNTNPCLNLEPGALRTFLVTTIVVISTTYRWNKTLLFQGITPLSISF
jgi:hypothetical protein